MPSIRFNHLLCAAALALAAGQAQALGVTDAVNDYVPGYTGSTAGDLDVIGSFVTYNPVTDMFVFSGTMNADIGSSAGGLYVWGVDRGAGTARFAPNGISGVLFDAVVIFNANGTGTVNRIGGANPGATVLPAGTVHSFGSTIIGEVSGSLLTSTGFAHGSYTWNLWPRDGTLPAGFGQISDFAPDNSNLPVTVLSAVPEPAAAWLLAGGLAGLAWRRRSGLQAARGPAGAGFLGTP
jgi:hypothetical protein